MPGEILVAIDETCSMRDVDRAIEIARDGDAHVTVVALEGKVAIGVVPISAPDGPTMRRRLRLAAIGREARTRAERAGADLDVVSRTGSPTRAILDEARARRADVVVVGDGISWTPRWARTRSARRLRRGSPCPVLFVP